MISFLRVIKFAFQDFGRNIGLSFMTIIILILMLLSIDTLLIVRIMTDTATAAIKDQIDVSIYFNNETKDKEVDEVKNFLQSFPEVINISLIGREQVLQQFKDKYKDSPDVTAALNELGENPLGPTMIVKTRQPEDYQNIIAALSVPEYENMIESKTFDDTRKAINKIDSVTKETEKFNVALSGFFIFVSFLVIFNTIRSAIYTQRIEISIKKLVGASNWFIRGPYLVVALIFSLISVALSYCILYFINSYLDSHVSVVFQKGSILTNYFNSHIIWLLGLQFGAVLILTVLSTFLAMRKHLRA